MRHRPTPSQHAATIVTLLICSPLLACAATDPVSWNVDGATIAGTLSLPEGAGPFPAIVLAPGSGSIGRNHAMAAAHADRLPRAGIAVLTFDKRGVGESTGDWRRETLADYAADVAGGIAVLQRHPKIDRTRIGLIGHSQGGWTGPIAATKAAGVAFLVLVSATALSPLDQSMYVEDADMTRRALRPEDRREYLALMRIIFDVYKTDDNWDGAQRAIDAAKDKSWFDPKRIGLQPKDSWNWQWLRALPLDFDVAPILSTLAVPLLTVNGGLDRLVPAERSRELFEQIRKAAGHPVTSVVIDGLQHGMGREERDAPADSYWNVVLPWLAETTRSKSKVSTP